MLHTKQIRPKTCKNGDVEIIGKIFLFFCNNLLTNRKKCSIIVRQCEKRLVGQAVKTSASHAENMGSIPVRVTIKRQTLHKGCLFFYCASHKTEPTCATKKLQFIILFCARGSHTTFGGILRYSACRPPNSKFPYLFAARSYSLLFVPLYTIPTLFCSHGNIPLAVCTRMYHTERVCVDLWCFFVLVTRTRNLTRRRTSLGSHLPLEDRQACLPGAE